MFDIRTVLERAAAASESTTYNASIIRPSKAGYGLVAQVLESLVFPKLPQPPVPTDTRKNELKALSTRMSIASGYLFEANLIPLLESDYSGWNIVQQPQLTTGSFTGHADFLIVSPDKLSVVVIDAKCFGVATLREIKERKLTDNWGYQTQLALYQEAAKLIYPEATITAAWYCWSTVSRKLFVVMLPSDVMQAKADAAHARVNAFLQVKSMLEAGEYTEAAKFLVDQPASEQLLPKSYMYNNLCAATSFHYSPYAGLFYYDPADDESDNDGYPISDDLLERVIASLARDAYEGSATANYQEYLNEFSI